MMLRRPWRQSMVFGTRMTRFESPGRLISVSFAMMMGAPGLTPSAGGTRRDETEHTFSCGDLLEGGSDLGVERVLSHDEDDGHAEVGNVRMRTGDE